MVFLCTTVMRRKNKRKIFKILPLAKMVPNLATLSALFVGITQIKFALKEQWEYAIIAVIGAAILDATDGRLARMLNACSRFGAELDSLSDMVVFGVCPAIVIYIFGLSEIDRLGWCIAAFFAICMSLRLARFNVQDIENITTALSKYGFSVGVPAPAGAMLALSPIILYNAFGFEIFKDSYFCAVVVLMSGFLCISKIPTPTIKKIHIKREQYMLFLLSAIIAVGIVFTYTWKALCLIILLYIVSIFFCISKAKKVMNSSDDQANPNKQL